MTTDCFSNIDITQCIQMLRIVLSFKTMSGYEGTGAFHPLMQEWKMMTTTSESTLEVTSEVKHIISIQLSNFTPKCLFIQEKIKTLSEQILGNKPS